MKKVGFAMLIIVMVSLLLGCTTVPINEQTAEEAPKYQFDTMEEAVEAAQEDAVLREMLIEMLINYQQNIIIAFYTGEISEADAEYEYNMASYYINILIQMREMEGVI